MILTFFVLFLAIWRTVFAAISFEKDSGLDTIFPPILGSKRSEFVPLGHLRPLGFQGLAQRKITEYKYLPSNYAFYHGYVKEEQPILFKEAVPTETMKQWTDDFLKETYGDLWARVTIKRFQAEHLRHEKKTLQIKKFLREYKYEDWYLASTIPQEMRKHMPLPKVLQCGTISKHLMESQIWMAYGGVLSLLHYHGDHQLHCLLDGRKDFIFINKKYARDFKMVESNDYMASGYSNMDTDMVNTFEYKKVGDIPWEYASMSPGDCVFVPAGMLHHVRSYGRSVSSVSTWAPTLEADFSDCQKNKPDNTRTLDDANFMWTYVGGKKMLSNVKLNSVSLRHHLYALLRKDDTLPAAHFETFYKAAMKGVKRRPKPKSVWELFDTKKVGHITRQEIKKLPKKVVERVAAILNKAHELSADEKQDKKDTKKETKRRKDEL